MKKYLLSWAVILLLLALMVVLPARAQDQQAPPAGPPDQQTAPQGNTNPSAEPQPGMARISYVRGDVSSQRGDTSDWVAVTPNTPVASGDRVATGQKGRAEVQLDAADVLRMSDNATVKLANLNRTNIQVQIGQGLVTYNVLKGAQAASEIDTPNAAVHPDGPGEYRVLVNSDAETQVIVREGSADISTPQGSTHVDQGQLITVAGTDNPEYKTASAPGRDEWDSWNNDRNHRISGAESWQKTDPYYTGSEDLDTYGTWSEVPDYGQVWTPAQGPGWAPYSSGRWVWEPYYGWTWVSYEPWGWAPYHYGRWFVYGGNWAWWPGPVGAYPYYYPVWAPAYVSFFGWGGGGWGVGFGFGFGFGNIGWLPCGPGDWFHPWYGRWGGGFRAVGIRDFNSFHEGFGPLRGGSGFSNVNEAFRNGRVRAGASSMASNQFGRAAVSGHSGISEASFRQASMMTGRSPISPSRASYSPSGRAANPASFRDAPSSSQRFFSSASRTNLTGSRSLANASNAARGESGTGANRNGGSFGAQSSQTRAETMNSNGPNTRGSIQSSRPGWHAFNPPQSGGANHSGQGFGSENRSGANASARGGFSGTEANNPGSSWQHYSPSSHPSQAQSSSRGSSQAQSYSRGYSPESRGNSSSSYSYSRPPLNMRQPIMGPRSGSSGGYGAYSQPRGYSAPRGNSSAPRGGSSAPRGGGGSRGGGGHSSGGRR
jgi:hypothetical protein